MRTMRILVALFVMTVYIKSSRQFLRLFMSWMLIKKRTSASTTWNIIFPTRKVTSTVPQKKNDPAL